ncbi:MAG: M20 family metallopeptidase [Bacteroidetes bacterium]|nr:M20 family metallopeptidase [Bacteroidota bacterium]
MNHLKERIKALSIEYQQEIVEIRRHFHANPELSMQEYRTSASIASYLESYDIPFKKGMARTGIVGIIEGQDPASKVIALRADMDALPLDEKSDVPYSSKISNVMHACGHDVHMACQLGAAKILKALSNEYSGTVKLIFQPSEEQYPGGAIMMINEGVLENPHVDKIFGLHVYPDLDAGKVGMKAGKYMASSDELYFTVRGRGGHGATPHLNIDPIVISANIIQALQTITSRSSSPLNPTVLTIGRVMANGKTNITPDEVIMEGTLRTYDDAWRKEAIDKIITIAQSVANAYGGSCEIFVDKGYPFLYNDPGTTAAVRNYAEELLGKDQVVELDMRMTAEDFAYYAHARPACFYRLGIRNEAKGITANLHNAQFDVDESCLAVGMGLMAWIAVNELFQDK